MSRSKRVLVPEEQRIKIEQRHAAERAALSTYVGAADRLATAEAHRVEVLAEQDRRIADARSEQETAAVSLAGLIGVEAAAELTGMAVGELRRCVREAK